MTIENGSSNNNKNDGTNTACKKEGQQQQQRIVVVIPFWRRPIVLLTIFVVQNSTGAIVGRAIRTSSSKQEDLFNISHFLLVSEICKLVLSLILESFHQRQHQQRQRKQQPSRSPVRQGRLLVLLLVQSLQKNIFQKSLGETLQLAVPALLFFGSNTLRYVAQEYLTVPIFQVTVQSRLVTTAVWSVILLQRRYRLKQWICLFVTTLGVVLVVLGEYYRKQQTIIEAIDDNLEQQQQRQRHVDNYKNHHNHLFFGLFALGTAATLSSLASVYLEKILKGITLQQKNGNAKPKTETEQVDDDDDDIESLSCSNENNINSIVHDENETNLDSMTMITVQDGKLIRRDAASSSVGKDIISSSLVVENTKDDEQDESSLWIRNIQLAFFSIIICIVQIIMDSSSPKHLQQQLHDYDDVQQTKSFFHGFNILVWVGVVSLSAGGIVVAAVTKYADSVLKGMAYAVSVVTSTGLSLWIFASPSSHPLLANAIEKVAASSPEDVIHFTSFAIGATMIIISVYLFSNPFPTIWIKRYFTKTTIIPNKESLGTVEVGSVLMRRKV